MDHQAMSQEEDLGAKAAPLPASELRSFASDIVSAYVAHHTFEAAEVPALIQSVYGTLASLGVYSAGEPKTATPEPAVPIKKSVFPDYIICLEDGIRLKMVKRHLRTVYNMTPDEYRAKWGLPESYPMVAPTYAARRSTLAKASGLGHKKLLEGAPEPEVQMIPEGQRGRKRSKKIEES